ncbi:MAG: O-antigen ligase family protein, partial [Dehalococcoidia bacterium]|nr:O-antigen ligase family protein [Dehalococcoidia bacterium]
MLITAQPRTVTSVVPAFLGLAATVGASVASAFLLDRMGFWALALPLYVITITAIALYPAAVLTVLLALVIVFEPGMFDFTEPVSKLLYTLPPGWDFYITVSPLEVLLLIAATSLVVHPRTPARDERLPYLVWTVPLVLLAGLLYGLRHGAPTNLAYHEMRGLIFGMVIFVAVMRFPAAESRRVMFIVLGALLVLAAIALLRYVNYLRDASVASESAFAHETPAFLAIGIVIAAALLLRGDGGWWRRLLLLAVIAVLFMAIIGTERRAGTLVLMAGVVTVLVLTFRSRPLLVGMVSVVLLAATSVYVAAYWNQEYGALAQPARAIRSQISPSARDFSSDSYRDTEKVNVAQTIRLNKIFGIGFGRAFVQFQPLPDLTSFWPLQSYTPHQNI